MTAQRPEDEGFPVDEVNGGRRFDSLDAVFFELDTPAENRSFIKEFTDSIGIEGYYARSGYVKALRTDGGMPLNIAFGWSNGFTSEEEVLRATGGSQNHWPSGRGTGLWGVTHPRHGGWDRGDKKSARAEGNTCPTCNNVLSLSGECAFCD